MTDHCKHSNSTIPCEQTGIGVFDRANDFMQFR